MKICYLANVQSVHTQRWARHFSDRGHQVTVISFQPGSIDNIPVIQVPRRTIWRRLDILLNINSVRKIVKDISPDILHAHYVTSYGLAGALASKHPFVITVWGSDVLVTPEQSWIYRPLVGFALKQADLVTTTAPNATQHIIARKYAAATKIVTFPFGVDTDVFNPSIRNRKHRDGSSLIISTRYFDHGSDLDIFIMAIQKVIRHYPNTRFLLVGDGPLRTKLEKLADRLKIKNYVEIRGEISHWQMPALLGEADIYISTYPSDTNHVSLNEAMACGAFPVVTDIPANRAWIRQGENGLLFPCKDADNLANAIVEALQKPEWRQSVMAENWNIVRTKASWSNSMAEMERHYRRLLGEKDHN